MRLWSLHPSYGDRQGLVALWREGLLARKVLLEQTAGYRHHPQLARFEAHADPVSAVEACLRAVVEEATRRGYCFDARKLSAMPQPLVIPVTDGQLRYEFAHLKRKLQRRAPAQSEQLAAVERQPHVVE